MVPAAGMQTHETCTYITYKLQVFSHTKLFAPIFPAASGKNRLAQERYQAELPVYVCDPYRMFVRSSSPSVWRSAHLGCVLCREISREISRLSQLLRSFSTREFRVSIVADAPLTNREKKPRFRLRLLLPHCGLYQFFVVICCQPRPQGNHGTKSGCPRSTLRLVK